MTTFGQGIAGNYSFTIEKNADFKKTLLFKNPDKTIIDLTGFTARMTIKDRKGGDDLIKLTIANGRITMGGVLGTIVLTIDKNDMAVLVGTAGAYDLILVQPDTKEIRQLQGYVKISEGVTA